MTLTGVRTWPLFRDGRPVAHITQSRDFAALHCVFSPFLSPSLSFVILRSSEMPEGSRFDDGVCRTLQRETRGKNKAKQK